MDNSSNIVLTNGFEFRSTIGRVFSIFAKKPLFFIILAILIQITHLSLNFFINTSQEYPKQIALRAILIIIFLFIEGIASCIIFFMLKGYKISFYNSILQVLKKSGSLFILFVIVVLFMDAMIVLQVESFYFLNNKLYPLPMIIIIILGLMILTRWLVSAPALIIENLGPIDSLKRSSELTKGYRFRVFVLMFTFSFIASLFNEISDKVIIYLSPDMINEIVIKLFSICIVSIPLAITIIVPNVIYYDLRSSKEAKQE